MAIRYSKYAVSPTAIMRRMGDDLILVDEEKKRVVLLNPVAKAVFDCILNGLTVAETISQIKRGFSGVEKIDLKQEVARVRKELLAAGVLEAKRRWSKPVIKVSDLTTALKEMDLSRSTVSQYE
ncbi:MAG: PqqD family protein [Zoogloeaceae bacterium]|nr:PqqD family protein [Zoogloeaceae bacterium]